jgi:hypothetical protein
MMGRSRGRSTLVVGKNEKNDQGRTVKTRLGRMFAGRRVGAVMLLAAVAVVSAGGTAAGFALTSGGASSAVTPPPTTKTVPMAAPVNSTTTSTTMPTVGSAAPAAAAAAAVPAATPSVSILISDTCLYSHEANDDPILDPGKPGQSMAHDFFGNMSTSASSTSARLVGGSSTCSTNDDASAYWTPVLYQNGVAVTPLRNLIYWSGLHAASPSVVAPPAGLEMIAGNENATAPQPTSVIDWRCANSSQIAIQPVSDVPVNCPGTKGIELRVAFPSCWNGSTLNGASETNVAYPEPGRARSCPAGYPVRIPTVIFHIIYPITSTSGLTLSMGPGQQGSTDTAHGDFINGWNQSVLTRLIDGCAGLARTCGHVTGSDALVRPKKV